MFLSDVEPKAVCGRFGILSKVYGVDLAGCKFQTSQRLLGFIGGSETLFTGNGADKRSGIVVSGSAFRVGFETMVCILVQRGWRGIDRVKSAFNWFGGNVRDRYTRQNAGVFLCLSVLESVVVDLDVFMGERREGQTWVCESGRGVAFCGVK